MKLSVFWNHIQEAAAQQKLDVKEVLRRVRAAGVSHLELELAEIDEKREELLPLIRESGFGVSCVYGFHNWQNGDYASGRHQVDTALELGAVGILVIPGFVTGAEADEMNRLTDDAEALWRWLDGNKCVRHMVEGLKETVRYAAGRLDVVMEDFDGATAPFATLNGLRYFMDRVPGLRFAMDCGNFAYSDEDAMTAFEQLYPLIVHVHTKDRGEEKAVLAKHLKFNRGLASVAAGDGYLPVGDIVSKLLSDGYNGFFAIEHFGSPDHLRDILRSAAYLQSGEKN